MKLTIRLAKSTARQTAEYLIESAISQNKEIEVTDWEVLAHIVDLMQSMKYGDIDVEFYRIDEDLKGQPRINYTFQEMIACIERDIECRPIA